MAGAGGNERGFCCCSLMPPTERSESPVSDYSAAPRQNGVLSSLFPDPVHLDDVTTSSVC